MTFFLILSLILALLHLPELFGFNFPRGAKARMRVALGLSFIIAGVSHFAAAETFLKLVPPFLPFRLETVYLSGAIEILLGAAFITPNFKRSAAIGLIALLIAVFPANVYVALANVQIGGYMNLPVYQWVRLPFQFVLIWLVWWSALSELRRHSMSFFKGLSNESN